MILDGQGLGVKWSTVGAGDVKKHSVILRSKVHVYVVWREGQTCRFGRPAEIHCLDDCQVVAIAIASMDASGFAPLM